MDAEQKIQERIEQLEAGAPLNDVLKGLPEEEAALVELAAALRQLPHPARNQDEMIVQRAALLRQAADGTSTNDASAPLQLSFMERLQQWLHGRSRTTWALTAAAGIIIIFLFIGLLNRGGEANVAQNEHTTAQEDDKRDADSNSEGSSLLDNLFGRDEETGETAESDIAEADADTTEAPIVAEADVPYQVFVPSVTSPLQVDAKTAVLDDLKGIVEVQNGEGKWTAVSKANTLVPGQRVRTGGFSSASLTFYDGSRAEIGPNSELAINELNALRPEDGFRTVILTQWLGESEHHVAFRNDRGSRYEVRTPDGSGVARGTIFQVIVSTDLLSRYVVTEGRVDVTNVNVTVSLIAGQISTILNGEPPSRPAFRVTGEGEVTQTGDEWIIGGQTFLTDDSTIIVGNPQVGDIVRVEGHLNDDGGRVADRIVLLRRALTNNFSLTGEVETIGDAAWVVAGQTISITATTLIDEGIVTGDTVQVEGLILADGSLQADQISLIEEAPGLPFAFSGVVESLGDDGWLVAGVALDTDDDTQIADDVAVGDLVTVTGWILPDGTWLAASIELLETETAEFSFTGPVDNIDPWVVAGIPFETRAWTVIADDIEPGDRVRVEGVILEDGAWVATHIIKIDETLANTILFVGIVSSIDPWTVNGITLNLDDDSLVVGDIVVGSLVQVEIELLPDGTWRVLRIQLLESPLGLGCFTVNSVVTSVNGRQITLRNWPTITLDDDVEIEGNLAPNAVITFHVCVNDDGDVVIVNTVIVIYQIVVTPPPPPPSDDDDDDGGNSGNGQVTICHVPPGNPSERHTITVGIRAWEQEHSKHGDTLGPCP